MKIGFDASSLGLLFPAPGAAILFGIVLSIWILSEIIGGIIIPSRKRSNNKIQQRKTITNSLSVIPWMLVLVIPPIFAASNLAPFPGEASYVGSGLIVVGIAVRQWAIAVLGRYFSNVIGVQEDQKVVETGPYRLIRHPSYSGILLIYAGIGLAFHSWGAVLINILIFGIFFGFRMLAEEKILISELGSQYIEYMKRTKRIIPFLI